MTVPNDALPTPIRRIPGYPLLGHLPSWKNDRIGLLLRLNGPDAEIVEVPMGPVRRVIMIGSPALANEVLVAKHSSFVKASGFTTFLRPVLGEGLLTSEPPVHTRQRRILAPAFVHKRIASCSGMMAERASCFISSLRDGESIDVSDAMLRLAFEIVGKALFDAEMVDDADAVGVALTTAMESMMGFFEALLPLPPTIPTPTNLEYRRAVARLDEVIYRIIRRRRAEGGDRGDVLSILLAATDEDGSPMSDRQVRDEAMTLFLAGHETTANTLAWTFYLLDRHPEQRRRLETELDALGRDPTYEDLKQLPYTLAVVKETMRLYPPVYMLGRRTIEDTRIGVHLVKANTPVIVNTINIHQREDLWPSPQTFNPDRFLGDREKQLPRCAYLPFGAGPRICIGNHFGLMETQILVATMARRLRFELERSAPAELEPLLTLRPKGRMGARVAFRG